MLTATPAPPVAAIPHARDEALWAEEVARLLDAGTTLEPATHAAVLAVLASLGEDPTESRDTQQDARALLAALDTDDTLDHVLDADDARLESRGDGHRSLGDPSFFLSFFRQIAFALF